MSKLEQQVMAGVASIYTARTLTSAVALKVYALTVSVLGVAAVVSLPHVALNFLEVMHGGVSGVALFLLAAVLQTKVVVQLALLIASCIAVSLMVDALRTHESRLAL